MCAEICNSKQNLKVSQKVFVQEQWKHNASLNFPTKTHMDIQTSCTAKNTGMPFWK